MHTRTSTHGQSIPKATGGWCSGDPTAVWNTYQVSCQVKELPCTAYSSSESDTYSSSSGAAAAVIQGVQHTAEKA
jgi:hypothetical protein